MSYKTRVKINVYGKVQNIGFRMSIQKFAQERGITGWAANIENGSLIINAEGKKPDIKQLIDYCEKGPSGSVIERCEAYYQKYKDEFTRFQIR